MASLVVTIDRVALGSPWRVSAPELARRARGYLDESSTLFVVVVERGRAIVIAAVEAPRVRDDAFEGGVVLECEHDITPLLPRLACRDPREAAAWRSSPRVLTPVELDVLRYALRLGVTSIPSPPDQLVDDARARELREAVWRDPRSDLVREIYADHLLDRGDPRGELIALQLRRARAGGQPCAREVALLRGFAADCAQPLTRYLKPGYRLRRGFLATCETDDAVAMPREITVHPAWSTVEAITTNHTGLLEAAPLASAIRLSGERFELAPVAARATPVAFEVVVGPPLAPRDGRVVHHGLHPYAINRPPEEPLAPDAPLDEVTAWRGPMAVGALARLRVLSLRGDDPAVIEDVLDGELGARLHQLDVVTTFEVQHLRRWRAAFDRATLPVLSFRFVQALPERRITISDQIVALERTPAGTRVIVELEHALARAPARVLLRTIAQLSRGLAEVEVRCLGEPARIADRQAQLRQLLGPLFARVILRDEPLPSLAP